MSHEGTKQKKTPEVLAVKWGYNPNSSSLGVDVTFLLFGVSAMTLVTPLVGWWLRARMNAAQAATGSDGAVSRER